MNNFDLDRAARGIDLPPGDMDIVTARGATLASRRRRVVAGGLTVALVAASAGLYARLNQAKPVPVQVGSATAQRGDVPIRWEKIDAKSGLGFTTTITGDPLYAVSTAPGRAAVNDSRRVLYHSSDGVDWSAVTELKDLYLANLADHGTRLYGVGTGPATAAVAGRKPVADLIVGASDDGGRNWQRQTLAVDVRAISAKSRSVDVYATDVASTKDAVVAVVTMAADLDVPAVLPTGVSAPHGWALTANGVDVLGAGADCPAGATTAPPGQPDKRAIAKTAQGDTGPTREYPHECYQANGTGSTVTPQASRGVAASFTWDQLHVDGDLLRAVKSEPMVFRSDAGVLSFQRVESTDVSKLDGPGMLETDGDGLILVGQVGGFPDGYKSPAPSVVLRSLDGRSWTTSPAPEGQLYTLAIGRLGDRTAMMGETSSGPALWVSDGNDGWTTTSLAGAVDPSVRDKANVGLASAAIGPLGAVAVVSVMHDPIAERGGVAVSRDGYTLRILNDRWAATVTDRDGREVAHSDSVMPGTNEGGALRGDTSDGSITLVDPQTNAVVVRFPADLVGNAMKNGMSESRSTPSFRVVASRDGLTWSDLDVNELAGERIVNITRVLMTGEKAVIAVSPSSPDSKEPAKQIALVGTPR